MPQEPEFDLERLLAEDEAAIKDDGFSQRIAHQAERQRYIRNVTLYGAGMAGFGIAAGSIIELAPHMTWLTGWVGRLDTAVKSDMGTVQEVGALVQAGGMPMLAAIALAGGVLLSVFAFAQSR